MPFALFYRSHFRYKCLSYESAIENFDCLLREFVDEAIRSSEQIRLFIRVYSVFPFFRFMLKLSDILPIRMRGR